MKRITEMIINFRIIIIGIIIIITLFLFYNLLKIEIDPNIASYLPKSDKAIQLFDYIGENFNGSLMAMIAFESDSIFTNEFLIKLSEIKDSIEMTEGIISTTSLINIVDIVSENDDIVVKTLIDQYALPLPQDSLEKLKDYILSNDSYKGSILSNNGKFTLLIMKYANDLKNHDAITKHIKSITKKSNIKANVYYAGNPFLVSDISEVIVRDLKVLVPFVSILMIIILLITFRTILGVILPLISVLISTVWTLGLMSLFKKPLTMISDIIPVLLMAVGSAYSIHVISKIYEIKEYNKENFINEFKEILIPVFLAAFTTIIGFVSFIFGSYLTMIRDFGIFLSIGVLIAFIISITFVPIIMYLLQNKNKKTHKSSFSIAPISSFIIKYNKYIIIFSILLSVLTVFGMFNIKRKADILDYFDKNSYTQKSERIIQKHFGGSTTIQILCKGNVNNPIILEKILKIENKLKKEKDIHNVTSIATIMRKLNKLIEGIDTIPNTERKISNLWFFIDGEDFINNIVNSSKDEALIIATFAKGLENTRTKTLIKTLNTFFDSLRSEDFDVQLTGTLIILNKIDESIVKSQIQSIIIAIILIFILLLIFTRSFVGSLIALTPIVFALMIVFGFMGISNIPLDIATSLIGGVSIGIGIDYTFHFNERFKRELKKHSINQAIKNTISTTGTAIVINMLTVIAGFFVLVFANLIPLRRFGILISITMFASAFGAIFILPSILLLNKKRSKNENN